MKRKGTETTTGYLNWEDFQRFVDYTRKEDRLVCAFSAIATYCGLRISDVLGFKWGDFKKEYLKIKEKKTGKSRKIPVHKELKEIIESVRPTIKTDNDLIFINKWGHILTRGYINRRIKECMIGAGIVMHDNVSSHLFRKTFARHALDKYDNKDYCLLLLMDTFRHSSIAITKKYLGIREEEIHSLYRSM